jgi:hypothetical protein
MKRFDILRTVTFLILVLGVFSGSSCPGDDTASADPKCGDPAEWTSGSAATGGIFANKPTYTEVIGDRRYFVFEDLNTPNICKEEHVKVNYYVQTVVHDAPVPGLNIYGKAYWWLTAKEKTLAYDSKTRNYEAWEYDLGLKQGVKEGEPAYVGLQIHANFPTRGDYATDVAYFDSLVTVIGINLSYYQFKK